jgi:endonuclease/exonuclease/phosphatase (EEP) superfamily protein YafD
MKEKMPDDGLLDRFVWLGVAGAVLSLAGALGHYNLFLDLISNFRMQYIAGTAVLLLFALFRRQFVAVLVLFIVLGVHVYGTLPYWRKADGPVAEPDLRVMTCNLLANNREHTDAIRIINRHQPDIMVFQEYSNQWHDALGDTLARYPHRVVEQLDNPFSIALFSLHPLSDSQVVAYSGSGVPSIEATVDLEGRPLKVIGTHPWPPEREWSFNDRNQHLQAIAAVTAEQGGPMLVFGDLNIAPWSAHFNTLLRDGLLRDARIGFGVMPTWPAGYFPLMISIDHILVNEKLAVANMQSLQMPGSDHLCLMADLALVN